MAAWTTRKASTTTNEAGFFTGDDDKQRKTGDDDDDDEGGARTTETRVLVRVSDLKEPCMAALLEAAEEQFGYGQQGVLKVPCDAQRFHHVVNMARKSPKY